MAHTRFKVSDSFIQIMVCLSLIACGSSDDEQNPVSPPDSSDTGSDASDPDGSGDVSSSENRAALLASVTDRVFIPVYQNLVQQTEGLRDSAQAYALAAAEAEAPDERAAAQEAFQAASIALQAAELLQIGPYGLALDYTEGSGIRERMYSWPDLVSACRVDQELVAAEYDSEDFFNRPQASAYGFDALERLLFVDDEDNACAPQATINSENTWETLGEEGRRVQRAAYAAAIAEQLALEANQILSAWIDDGFSDQFKNAGQDTSPYSSTQEALNELYISLYYVESEVKDIKLGAPLGITQSCSNDTDLCPDRLESQNAQLSLEWVLANLTTTQKLIHGGEPGDDDAYGFADLLRDTSADELADQLEAGIQAALDALAEIDGPLANSLTSEEADTLYTELREFNNLLKTQVVSVLNVELPSEGAADND